MIVCKKCLILLIITLWSTILFGQLVPENIDDDQENIAVDLKLGFVQVNAGSLSSYGFEQAFATAALRLGGAIKLKQWNNKVSLYATSDFTYLKGQANDPWEKFIPDTEVLQTRSNNRVSIKGGIMSSGARVTVRSRKPLIYSGLAGAAVNILGGATGHRIMNTYAVTREPTFLMPQTYRVLREPIDTDDTYNYDREIFDRTHVYLGGSVGYRLSSAFLLDVSFVSYQSVSKREDQTIRFVRLQRMFSIGIKYSVF